MAVASPARAVPAEIVFGRVVEVDPDRWVCRVLSSDPVREFSPVLVSSLFMGTQGEGIHAMPEVGVRVYVAVPSDGTHAFIVGYAFTVDETTGDGRNAGSLHSGRPHLNPGDIAALTRDQNGVVIRRGGIVEIRSTPLARTIYNPQGNQVLTIAESWEVETFGGNIAWKNLQREDDQDGELSARFQQEVRQYVDSPRSSVRIQMGATEGARLELDGPVPAPPLVDTTTTLQLLAAGSLAPQPITLSVKRPSAADPAARVVDLRVYDDERDTSAEESFVLGVSRQGAVLIETGAKVRIADGEDTGDTEPVLRGTTFLTSLALALEEISTGLNALGFLTPATASLLADIRTSKASGAPFLSSTLESE
jgi:hypothetical protein